MLGGKAPAAVKGMHVDTSAKSNWKCGCKTCQEKIPQAVVDMYLKRQEKRGNGSKAAPVPQHLLCSDCHDKHAKGTDITLGDGTVKRHYQQKDDADDDRKAKNKEKNQRRKARKAEAKKEAKADAEATQSEKPAENTDKSESNATLEILRKMNEVSTSERKE